MILSVIVVLLEKQMPLLEAPFGLLTRRTFLHTRIELLLAVMSYITLMHIMSFCYNIPLQL
jgi:hypothetical protein